MVTILTNGTIFLGRWNFGRILQSFGPLVLRVGRKYESRESGRCRHEYGKLRVQWNNINQVWWNYCPWIRQKPNIQGMFRFFPT